MLNVEEVVQSEVAGEQRALEEVVVTPPPNAWEEGKTEQNSSLGEGGVAASDWEEVVVVQTAEEQVGEVEAPTAWVVGLGLIATEVEEELVLGAEIAASGRAASSSALVCPCSSSG